MKNGQLVILSVNYGGHDTSAALMINGTMVAACEQERFDLIKHSRAFPSEAASECLKLAGITIEHVDEVAYTMDVYRYIRETYLRPGLESDKRIDFLVNDLERIKRAHDLPSIIREKLQYDGPVRFVRHHLTHLASTYYPSGFDRALLISHDGMGEIEASAFGMGDGGEIELLHDQNRYPDSLGLLYSAITFYLGWKHHCDEGIVMGLAPYGDPFAKIPGRTETYYDVFAEVLQEDGPLNYHIDRSWIAYHEERDVWVSEKFKEVFGPKRDWHDDLGQSHMNVASALQRRLEDVVTKQLSHLKKEYDCGYLAIAGGVGLNCSLNGKIHATGEFREIFVQPASGDAGCAIGACYIAHKGREAGACFKKNHDSYLGSYYSDAEIKAVLDSHEIPYSKPENFSVAVAKRLVEGKIVGWFQGRSEFGPRALGCRSILCRPYPRGMKDHLNLKVKFREYFRPFAPAVLWEYASEYFEIEQESPHMLIAVQAVESKKEEIPAVVHVDGSCRVQTVREENNPKFWKLLNSFKKESRIPVLLNTSFNVKGQPIVNSPEQAINCFQSTEIDCLAIGCFLVEKQCILNS